MEEYEYGSNSYKSRAKANENNSSEKKRVEKVVTGNVTTRKKSKIGKLADIFIAEDIASAKDYIIGDVIVPAIKNALFETVEGVLYGSTGKRRRSSSDRISYNKYSDSSKSYKKEGFRSVTSHHSYDDIVFENRGEAEEVIEGLRACIREYGVARVTDLYDLVGISGEYTDTKYGWSNLNNATSYRARGGVYMLDLPKALPLD